jgi:hypothetical protein
MLGIGIGVSKKTPVVGGSISPSDISGLDVWFKVNTGITAASGNTSDAGNMANKEPINQWDDQSGNNRHASQDQGGEKPIWIVDSDIFGGLVWPDDTQDTHLNMATAVGGDSDFIEANEDFTIMIRVMLTSFNTGMALMGSAAREVIKWTDATRVGIFIGGNTPIIEFDESEDSLRTDTYYIHTLTRRNGSTGNLTYHIHGGSYNDKFWDDDGSTRQDADAFTLNNIGCAADNALPVEGVFKDVLVWKGTALNDSQRNDMYTYINGQDY